MRAVLAGVAGSAILGCCLAAGWTAGVRVSPPAGPAPADRARPRTHAHNDYVHKHPLFDALHHGFLSIEADIFLVGQDLRVAHDPVPDWSAVPTLRAAYLSPLRDLKKRHNNGGVYADGTPVVLLVDVKSDGAATYARLHEVLAEYQAATPGLFTACAAGADGRFAVVGGAVTVIVSGNRPRDVMKAQPLRFAAYDGRLADVGPDVNPDDFPAFVPLISDNWKTVFKDQPAWDGAGEMPPETRAKLAQLVAAVHAEGKKLRFWNLPKDAPAAWGALYDAKVDLIGTDDLAGLSAYLAGRGAARDNAPAK